MVYEAEVLPWLWKSESEEGWVHSCLVVDFRTEFRVLDDAKPDQVGLETLKPPLSPQPQPQPQLTTLDSTSSMPYLKLAVK